MLLVYDCEYDDGCCCDDSPYEEADFAPEFPCSWAGLGVLSALAGEEGVFFEDVTVAAGVARGATCEERPSAWHAGDGEG